MAALVLGRTQTHRTAVGCRFESCPGCFDDALLGEGSAEDCTILGSSARLRRPAFMRVQRNVRKSARPVRRDIFPDHLLLDEVAELMGVHLNTVKSWIGGSEPALASVKFQGRRYIYDGALLNFAGKRGMRMHMLSGAIRKMRKER